MPKVIDKLLEIIDILKYVYKSKKYLALTISSAIISFVVFYKLTLATVSDNKLQNYIIMSGYDYTYFSLLSFVIISLLFGVYISLVLFKFNLKKSSMNKKKGFSGISGYLGVVAGVFGAGCPTCGSVVFAILGAPLALMYFPFRGFELRILSILILLISVYIISKSLIKCDVKIK